MKHSIALKFLAIVLCAASLTGALGSAGGILFLTQAGLYNKDLDQLRQESLDEETAYYGRNILNSYIAETLGEFPQAALADLYQTGLGLLEESNVAYQILDGEGTVLTGQNEGLIPSTPLYASYPAQGTYRRVIGVEEVEEPSLEPTLAQEELTSQESILVDNVPNGEMVLVCGVDIELEDESHGLYAKAGVGHLYHSDEGDPVLETDISVAEWFPDGVITAIRLLGQDEQTLLYAAAPEGVGSFSYQAETGNALFVVQPVFDSAIHGTVSGSIFAYAEPSLSSPVQGSLGAGYPVDIQITKTVNDVQWGYVSGMGWILMSQIVPEDTGEEAGAPETARSLQETEPTASTESTGTIEPVPDGYMEYYDYETNRTMRLAYTLEEAPEYTLMLYLQPEALTLSRYDQALELLVAHRTDLFYILAASILVLAVTAVYLCIAAGRKKGLDTCQAGGLNCLPLDLYLFLDICGLCLLFLCATEGVAVLARQNIWIALGTAAVLCYGAGVLVVGYCFAGVAQIKTPGGFWWRNCLCVRCCKGLLALCRWCWRNVGRLIAMARGLVTGLWRLVGKLWRGLLSVAGAILARIRDGIHRLVSLLPLMWQWLLAGGILLVLMMLGLEGRGIFALVCLGGCVAIVVYGAHCFAILAESTQRMSRGDLDIQVDDSRLIGAFRDFANNLNDLAGVAVVAAQKQLRSERMKTELITNVSHDIKTPLTSIINFVDLLQKPHTQEEEKQYLEVLDRQSQRMKKLIEDLIEMSKANTGNMAVDIRPLDGVETVNQALGEFSDKLEKAQLSPVFRRPEGAVTMMADGRLTWRVLSNLLGNAVKYALPGTRLYIDLMEVEGKVILSLKNISREELNVAADELMERFVRGDSSRNTEGSGLGLNIAKSLMELQKGQLQLLVDGDLFKVTLIFPGAK